MLRRINDITTDIADLPLFVAVLPLQFAWISRRRDVYAQCDFYPDNMSIAYIQSNAEVLAAAAEIINEMDWDLMEANAEDGRL